MSFFVYIKRERYKLLLNFLIAAGGFLAALLLDSAIDEYKERQVFKSVLGAVRAEAKLNQAALEKSFLPLYQKGIVLREFSTAIISQALANPVFVKHASADQLGQLSDYFSSILLSNAYRARVETLRFNKDYLNGGKLEGLNLWEDGLVQGWRKNLSACEASISLVSSGE